MLSSISALLLRNQDIFHPVVKFATAHQKIAAIDLSEQNPELPPALGQDLTVFQNYLELQRIKNGATFLVGGYAELRSIYTGKDLFENVAEPRRLHLGTDIWGEAGTPVFSFLGGMVHSIGYNQHPGDYGATMILLHQLEGIPFYTLYGHIALRDIFGVSPGQYLVHGQQIAHFGEPEENGQWPPHLHFQVITDLGGRSGDYPGVCCNSEREHWLANSPDPDFILQLKQYL